MKATYQIAKNLPEKPNILLQAMSTNVAFLKQNMNILFHGIPY